MSDLEWKRLNKYCGFIIGISLFGVIILNILGARNGSFHVISLDSGFWSLLYTGLWIGLTGFGGFVFGNIMRSKLSVKNE